MKSTKKSLFITTIAMVVLMVVALSTATFAWYTASGTTKAENAVLKTAQSSSANIAIGWEKTSDAISVTFADNSATTPLAPMAPTALITTETTPASIAFSTQTLDNEGNFNDNGGSASPWRTTENDTAARQDFYVINNNLNAGTTVSMTLTFPDLTADAEAKAEQDQMKKGLKIVVFINDAAYAIFANTGSTYKYGTITKGAAGDSLAAADGTQDKEVAVTNLDGTVTFNLDASNTTDDKDIAKITAMAWFDGVWLTQVDAGKGLGFSFNFVGGTLVP